jgi:16S rRNA (adenine1518-N6/adenine1519-N6)-dimethyltransferase
MSGPSEPSDPLRARSGRRPRWSEFRAALDAVGFRPSKTLGQNFLVDSNAARAIAEDAALPTGSTVLEIGAGCGFLTLHLAELGHEILAIEIDARLLDVAQRLLASHSSVRWLRADALDSKHALAPALLAMLPSQAAWHLVSNLPYSVAAPLLVLLSRIPNPPATLTALVQTELAARIASDPGEPEWGALAARLRFRYQARLGRAVSSQLFWPKPRVGSRVVHLCHAPLAGLRNEELSPLDALVETLFQHRRKQLLGSLAEALSSRAAAERSLEDAHLDPRQRPEALQPSELLALARTEAWMHAALHRVEPAG